MGSALQPASSLSRLPLLALCLLTVGAYAGVKAPGGLAQTPSQTTPVRPGNLSSTTLSLEGANQLRAEAEAAIGKQDYATAEAKLKTARETLNQISVYYQDLAQMFVGVDTAIHRTHRDQALQAAQLRDEVSYQLALVYRAKNQPDLAVPLLMEILRSQQPNRELGQKAYQQLFELGFVSAPYTARPAPTSGPQPQ